MTTCLGCNAHRDDVLPIDVHYSGCRFSVATNAAGRASATGDSAAFVGVDEAPAPPPVRGVRGADLRPVRPVDPTL